MATSREPQSSVPPNLVLTAQLSSGITIVSSISYIILCVIALIYRFNCDVAAPGTSDNAQLTWHMIYRIYIQDAECQNTLSVDNLTQSQTVFVLIILTLGFSVLNLITSIVLTVSVKKDLSQYLNVIVFAYITCWFGSLAVDVTLATHLGMDYGYLTQRLQDISEYMYPIDSLRHGAFVLMSVSLKGYVTLVLNLVLICLLITYSCEYQNVSNKEQHSIHKMGTINAFDQLRRIDDNWIQPEPISPYASSYTRGQTNNTYMNIDDQPRNLPRSDYYPTSNQSLNRSDSWQHQAPSHSSRPFSYMDDIRRSVPLKPPSSPAPSTQEQQWRRDPWPQAPPVPAPDYSPHTPRRLKSALKPAGYM